MPRKHYLIETEDDAEEGDGDICLCLRFIFIMSFTSESVKELP